MSGPAAAGRSHPAVHARKASHSSSRNRGPRHCRHHPADLWRPGLHIRAMEQLEDPLVTADGHPSAALMAAALRELGLPLDDSLLSLFRRMFSKTVDETRQQAVSMLIPVANRHPAQESPLSEQAELPQSILRPLLCQAARVAAQTVSRFYAASASASSVSPDLAAGTAVSVAAPASAAPVAPSDTAESVSSTEEKTSRRSAKTKRVARTEAAAASEEVPKPLTKASRATKAAAAAAAAAASLAGVADGAVEDSPDVTATAHNQLKSDPDAVAFYQKLTAFCREHNLSPSLVRPPLLGGVLIDLHKLYRLVQEAGGAFNLPQWKDIAAAFPLNSHCTSGIFWIRRHYMLRLLPYGLHHGKEAEEPPPANMMMSVTQFLLLARNYRHQGRASNGKPGSLSDVSAAPRTYGEIPTLLTTSSASSGQKTVAMETLPDGQGVVIAGFVFPASFTSGRGVAQRLTPRERTTPSLRRGARPPAATDATDGDESAEKSDEDEGQSPSSPQTVDRGQNKRLVVRRKVFEEEHRESTRKRRRLGPRRGGGGGNSETVATLLSAMGDASLSEESDTKDSRSKPATLEPRVAAARPSEDALEEGSEDEGAQTAAFPRTAGEQARWYIDSSDSEEEEKEYDAAGELPEPSARWIGSPIRSDGRRLFYNEIRLKDIGGVRVGDCVMLRPTPPDRFMYVCRIKHLFEYVDHASGADGAHASPGVSPGGTARMAVQWFSGSEDRWLRHKRNFWMHPFELLETEVIDENLVDTIVTTCVVVFPDDMNYKDADFWCSIYAGRKDAEISPSRFFCYRRLETRSLKIVHFYRRPPALPTSKGDAAGSQDPETLLDPAWAAFPLTATVRRLGRAAGQLFAAETASQPAISARDGPTYFRTHSGDLKAVRTSDKTLAHLKMLFPMNKRSRALQAYRSRVAVDGETGTTALRRRLSAIEGMFPQWKYFGEKALLNVLLEGFGSKTTVLQRFSQFLVTSGGETLAVVHVRGHAKDVSIRTVAAVLCRHLGFARKVSASTPFPTLVRYIAEQLSTSVSNIRADASSGILPDGRDTVDGSESEDDEVASSSASDSSQLVDLQEDSSDGSSEAPERAGEAENRESSSFLPPFTATASVEVAHWPSSAAPVRGTRSLPSTGPGVTRVWMLVDGVDSAVLSAPAEQDMLSSLIASVPQLSVAASVDKICGAVTWNAASVSRMRFAVVDASTLLEFANLGDSAVAAREESAFISLRQTEVVSQGTKFILSSLTVQQRNLFRLLVSDALAFVSNYVSEKRDSFASATRPSQPPARRLTVDMSVEDEGTSAAEEADADSDAQEQERIGLLRRRALQHYVGLSFEELLRAAQEKFIVSSESMLKSQLGELRDHKLVALRRRADGVDVLRINLSVDVLFDLRL